MEVENILCSSHTSHHSRTIKIQHFSKSEYRAFAIKVPGKETLLRFKSSFNEGPGEFEYISALEVTSSLYIIIPPSLNSSRNDMFCDLSF